MQHFLFYFNHVYNKLRRHGTTISDNLLTFKLLKAENILGHHKQLIKATISEINYDNIAKKIKSIFSNKTETSKLNDKPTYYTKETTSEEEKNENDNESHNELCDICYT